MQSQDNTLNGIGLLIISTFFFAVQDAITKHLIETLSVFQIVTIRFFFFALFAIVYAARRTEHHAWFRSANPVLQISRSLAIPRKVATCSTVKVATHSTAKLPFHPGHLLIGAKRRNGHQAVGLRSSRPVAGA